MTGKKPLPPLEKDVLSLLVSDARRKYSPSLHPAAISRLSSCGLNNRQIAEVLDIAVSTLIDWSNKYQVVRRALEIPRLERNLKVVDALYQRAIGYEHDHEDIRVAGGEVIITPVKKHVQPDVRAQEIWLYNRMPEHWKSRSAIELTGKDGGPLEYVNLTPEQEAEELALLGLIEAPSQLEEKEIDDDDAPE